MELHTLLLHQLKRLGMSPDSAPDDVAWKQLLTRVSRTYKDGDQDRYRLEHSMGVLSEEVQELLDELNFSSQTRLEAERNKLRLVLSSLGAGLVLADAQLLMDDANRVAERLLGLGASALRGKSLLSLLEPEAGLPQTVEATLAALQGASDGLLCGDNAIALRQDGSRLPISYVLTPVIEDEKVVGAVLVFLDMTERRRVEQELREARLQLEARVTERTAALASANAVLQTEVSVREQAEEQLRKSEARFRSLVVNGSDVILILGIKGQLAYASPSIERVLGFPRENLGSTNLFELVHPEEKSRIRKRFRHMLKKAGNHPPMELKLLHSDGTWRYLEGIATNLLGDPSVQGVVMNLRDITERKVLEQQLTQLAFWDPLTGLANRALLMKRLNSALSRRREPGTHFALLFLDLDNFKYINDSMGHAAGDALLTDVARRLLPTVRQGDTVARLGGDEFTVLLENIRSLAEAEEVVARIQERFQASLWVDSWEVVVSASIGLTLSGPDSTVTSLLREADLAMYEAKARGKSRCEVFRVHMHEAARKRVEMETGLRRAIRDGELRLFYQPIIELSTGRLRELEVLIRWQHPEKGFLPPSEFIPMAEQSGLIIPMGNWVMHEACRQLRAWQEKYPALSMPCVAINLSARQFTQKDLVMTVRKVLLETGLRPELVKLEITESVAMDDAGSAIQIMQQLRALGVALALDDFGTGYSSLNYLRRFPVNTLKIDRSFVDGIDQDPGGTTIVKAIVALAAALELELTAEGIETFSQAQLLSQMGCGQGQGYLFARPMPADAVERLLASNWQATLESRAESLSSPPALFPSPSRAA